MGDRIGSPGSKYTDILQDILRGCGRLDLNLQFGVVDADGKVEAREMNIEGRTTGSLHLDNNFLLVQPD